MHMLMRCFLLAALAAPTLLVAQHRSAEGRIVYLRANEPNDAFGNLTAEVVIQLDALPNWGLGLRLRNDAAFPANRAMFDLLRDGFNANLRVYVEFEVSPPNSQTGRIFRVVLRKP